MNKEVQMENYKIVLQNIKSLKDQIQLKNEQFLKNGPIYATIKSPEVMKGLTNEDYKRIEK